jgi:hypothetical protein
MAMPMAMQNMAQDRKLKAAQLQRQQELQDLETKQRNALALKSAPGSMSGKTPSTIEEWNKYKMMSPEDQAAFLTMKRANPWRDIGGSLVQPSPTNPKKVAGSIPKTIAPEKTREFVQTSAQSKAAGALAIKQVGIAFDGLTKVRTNIGNISEAISAIDAGAKSGPVYKMLPNVTASSVELANIRNRLGLDVIGNVTFGALSKGELDLALETAMPMGLHPKELRAWLVNKKAAQEKLAKYYADAATHLSKPGNTLGSWIEDMQARKSASGGRKPIPNDLVDAD